MRLGTPGIAAGHTPADPTHVAATDWRHPLARIDFDAAFTCWAFVTALFPLYLKSLTGVFFVLMPIAFFAYRKDRLVPFFKRAWPVLTFPAFAMLSTAWSVLPGITAYYSTQFMLSVLVAAIIGIGLDRREMLNGAFAAFLFHGTLTAAYGFATGELHHDDYYGFMGFAGSKNTTADMACLGLLIAIAMIAKAARERRHLCLLIAGALAIIEAYILYCAHSAGALTAVIVATFILVSLLSSRRLPPAARFTVLATASVAAATAAVTQSIWYRAFFKSYLRASGKDESITGRTYIWSRAEVLIHQHPMLGRGFGSFWRIGDLESEAIWAQMYVANKQGFNFHSSVYELVVYLGYAGLCLFLVMACVSLITLLIRTTILIRPTTSLYCAFLAYDGMRFQFEALPLGVFSHNSLLLYASFAAAFAAGGSPDVARYVSGHRTVRSNR